MSASAVVERTVELRRITAETVYEVCKLSETLSPEQRKMVADNGVSIAEAHFADAAWFRGVYVGDEPVGFLMLDLGMDPDEPGVSLWRFMIAGPHQGKGYGRRAIEGLVAHLKARGTNTLYTSYGLGPGSPEGFYRALGFEPTGELVDDETEAVLRW
ncbi:GNAT family N-acetyltransferase [Nocardia amikacinitolerans]|uniref:GNAT family N-acetyltransferase n=1 Tax=Nocardia amikacinitolerans TaxID=756689 RepID=UPI00083229E9|nr:GNAT family N-acetyltransferase [Nocardia amikacinitolerans]